MKKIIKSIIALALVVSMAFVTFGASFDAVIKEKYALKDYLTTFGCNTSTYDTAYDVVVKCNDYGYSGYYMVDFGEYPQDGISEMAKQPIKWIILEKSNGKALLMSLNILDNKKYKNYKSKEKDNVNTTWETSDLRTWLNNEFYNTAFDSTDKNKIAPYSLTGDNVFILNEAELKSYYKLDKMNYNWANDHVGFVGKWLWGNPWVASCYTSYAKRNITGSGYEYDYWLRDVADKNKVLYVRSEFGYLASHDNWVSEYEMKSKSDDYSAEIKNKSKNANSSCGVRPCVWVTYDDSVKSDREQALEQLGGDVAKNIIGGVIDSALPGASLLIP